MKNNFVIEASDMVVIQVKIDEIIGKNKLSKDNVIKYDMNEESISKAIEELDTYSFLTSNKIVVCYHCSFLSPTKNTAVEHSMKDLKRYLEHPNLDNYLIMVCDKLSDRKEIRELLEGRVTFVNTQFSIESAVYHRLEDYSMSQDVIKYFVGYCLNDNERILTELDKLKIYKIDDKVITIEDINTLVRKTYDDDLFSLINAIAKRNRELAFSIYRRLVTNERDVVPLIASVATQIRRLYIIKILLKDGYKINEVAKMLSISPVAVTISSENARNFSFRELLHYLNVLADMDIAIKTGKSNSSLAFELFLLKL